MGVYLSHRFPPIAQGRCESRRARRGPLVAARVFEQAFLVLVARGAPQAARQQSRRPLLLRLRRLVLFSLFARSAGVAVPTLPGLAVRFGLGLRWFWVDGTRGGANAHADERDASREHAEAQPDHEDWGDRSTHAPPRFFMPASGPPYRSNVCGGCMLRKRLRSSVGAPSVHPVAFRPIVRSGSRAAVSPDGRLTM